jgi:superfamily II DNA or RNA helicase
MIGDLSKDEARNDLIATEVRKRVTQRRRALVLTDRIEHATRLAGMLNDLRPVLLTGDVSNGDRTIGMEAVKAGARLTIATIHLLGEGVDVPGWDLLFLASPIAGGPRTLQAIGRVARPAPGKERAEVVDFVDSQVSALVSAWKQRQRLYAA